MAYQSPRSSQGQFAYNTSTPPQPPPKPSAQSSGTATPQAGPPRPPPPPGQDQGEQYRYGNAYQTEQPPQYATPATQGPPEGWLPDILKDKSTQDLQTLLSSPELLKALTNDPRTSHPSIAGSQQPLQVLLHQNLTLSTQLKDVESQLLKTRRETQQRLLSIRAIERQFRQKQTEQEAALKDFSAPALYQKLVGAISEQESLSKGLEESFLEDEGVATEREVTDFVRRFREVRKTAHLRRERKERWDEGRVGGWR